VTLRVRRFGAAGDFLGVAGDFLADREVEHNLMLGLAADLALPQNVYAPPFYLAALVDASGIVRGCALRTPPFKLLLSELPADAIAPLVADVAAFSPLPTAVSGDEPTARAFAEEWCARRGGAWHIGFRQRLYRLDTLVPPQRPAPGAPRLATHGDVALVASWLEAFGRDAGMLVGDAPARARALVVADDVQLWVDAGEPVSMAAVTGRTAHGARVGYVYTPPKARGRGYAGSCVAELSARLLAGGRGFCCLFTDLANPTSNAIYQRLGYRQVCDFVDCVFAAD
jgi:GNAT superfamily N-acetyltransferase